MKNMCVFKAWDKKYEVIVNKPSKYLLNLISAVNCTKMYHVVQKIFIPEEKDKVLQMNKIWREAIKREVLIVHNYSVDHF